MFELRARSITCLSLSATALALCACGGADDDAGPGNGKGGDGKTDTPAGKAPAEIQCEERRQDVIESVQATFTPTAIRWSCADVAGVNTVGQDDRGQEYCEYFALVQPPPLEEGGERPAALDLGRNLDASGRTSDLALSLTEEQELWLEDHPDEIVGTCVFTSWHSDVPGPLPACTTDAASGATTCPEVLGFPMSEEIFRMKISFNSNPAASALVRDCFKPGKVADPAMTEDPLHGDFYRACMMTAELYGTHWRRSDPAVCAASMRLAECGCSLPGDADIPTALVPPQPQQNAEGVDEITLRGFPLGTWSGPRELPSGCRYAEVGDQSQTLVLCDLSAAELLVSTADPKGRCRQKYGDNVVVHVPIPPGALSCSPPENGPYADTCSAMPWVVAK